MNLRDIAIQLHQEGQLQSPDLDSGDLPPAWYIRVLSALGAWLATLFLIFFWALFTQSESGLGVLGGVQCLLAALLSRQTRQEMLSQLALSLWLTGCCLLAFASYEMFSQSLAWQSLLFLGLALVYPESLGRFLTALVGGSLTVAACCEAPLPLDLLVGPLALLTGAHYLHQQTGWVRGWGRRSESFAGAAAVTVLIAMCVSFWRWCPQPAGPASTGLLTLAVLWLTTRVIARLQVPYQQGVWALGGLLALGALTYTTPGIMAGVGVLLLACEVHSRWLFLLGWIYLLLFTSAFYYNLDLLLRTKSLILMAMGLLLLAMRRKIVGP